MHEACAVFGHRKIDETDELKKLLYHTFEKLIEQGFEIFYFGGFGQFDDLCYKIVSDLRKKHPHIIRIFCLYDIRQLRENKRPKWLQEEEYEDYHYFDMKFDWWYQRIYFRNLEIIDHSDFVVFYTKEDEKSGAYKALKYAKKTKKKYINLFD